MTYISRPLTASDNDPTTDVRAILEDEYGGIARIIVDDHCYVLQLQVTHGRGKGNWKSVTHWFREATDELLRLGEVTCTL